MIAVHVAEAERRVVAEFFELFKTPWEFFHEGSRAEVVLSSRTDVPPTDAKLVLIYGSHTGLNNRADRVASTVKAGATLIDYEGQKLPIYGGCATFTNAEASGLTMSGTGEPVMSSTTDGPRLRHLIGYDLFQEIHHLLTRGQPAANAGIPALEIHIALLRDLILKASIPLVEIPPVPAGANLITCLTHDVDHVGIRNHKFDHTMFGFLYRATFCSLRDFFVGRKSLPQLFANWAAVVKLPLVHLGLARDFWYQFDHYVEIEGGARSTFFVIPRKGVAGCDRAGNSVAARAASYDAADLATHLQKLKSDGKEIGVHGIDAWRDSSAGSGEGEIISRLTDAGSLGIRMHWLYFDEQSPAELERAGFIYDSTVGYNETVGYRAGTTQVYRPLACDRLLELPMHAMDTALFYPSYLNLSPVQAREKMSPLIASTVRFGGVFTVNWHDRSLAPERLWDGAYRDLLAECRAAGAWFATAGETVAWFQKRRSARFVPAEDGRITITNGRGQDGLPGLCVRKHLPKPDGAEFVDHVLPEGGEMVLAA